MKELPKNQIFLFENVLSDELCNKLIYNINSLAIRECDYNVGNNVKCTQLLIDEIKDSFLKETIDSDIYKLIGNIIEKLQSKYDIKCRGDTGYELRKITGATRRHVDGTVSQIENYIKESKDIPNNQIRNMSVIIALNSDYEGGEFCFPEQNTSIKLKRGQALAFPPYWTHPHYTNDLKNDTYRYTITTWLTE
jgi:hypothetical protein